MNTKQIPHLLTLEGCAAVNGYCAYIELYPLFMLDFTMITLHLSVLENSINTYLQM